MRRVHFSCDDPLNQVSRVIDILRRMDAELHAIDLGQEADDAYETVIDYSFATVSWNDTFLHRLRLVPGVEVRECRPLVHLVSDDREPASIAG